MTTPHYRGTDFRFSNKQACFVLFSNLFYSFIIVRTQQVLSDVLITCLVA